MKLKLLLSIATLALIACNNTEQSTKAVTTPKVSSSAKVEALMADMTLDEKLAQISCVWFGKSDIYDSDGSFNPQKWMIEETRQGIPTLFHEEGLHGFQGRYATSFPQAIALAATFNPDIVEDVYSVTAREIRARGVHHVLSPVVDVALDPRWGRIEETFGEDPYLVSRMGVAAIKGFQGEGFPIADDKVLTTLKHMTSYVKSSSRLSKRQLKKPMRHLSWPLIMR